MPELNRRQALAGLGTVSLGALLAACADDDGPSGAGTGTETEPPATAGARTGDASLTDLFDDTSVCTLTPEQTEGPYYFDADAIRGDIREDRDGVRLRLALRVRHAESCEPLRNAVVDVWHCDAGGSYSGFEAGSTGDPAGSDDERYLRGAQVTNSDGIVEFTTVYPGWYPGRTVHIHAKVHLDRTTMLTTQLYFDERVTAAVYEREPYASRPGRDTFNDGDGIFDERVLLELSEEGDGYLGVISFDVDRT
jgi:protocatechuate 3,4-dioxygenase beta subunit